jgi:hypothetical protein
MNRVGFTAPGVHLFLEGEIYLHEEFAYTCNVKEQD